jgi:hypothetical protein
MVRTALALEALKAIELQHLKVCDGDSKTIPRYTYRVASAWKSLDTRHSALWSFGPHKPVTLSQSSTGKPSIDELCKGD